MKRIFHLTILVILILPACQPSPEGQGQINTPTPKINSTTPNNPENLDSICQTNKIADLDQYPTNACNFIINYKKSQENISEPASEEILDYSNILDLYKEEMKWGSSFLKENNNIPDERIDSPDFSLLWPLSEYEPLLSTFVSEDGTIDIWSLIMRKNYDGSLLIPTRQVGDDSSGGKPFPELMIDFSMTIDDFNLMLIPSPDIGLDVVFDKSGFPIIIKRDYSEWYSINDRKFGWIDITEDEKKHLGLIKAKTDKLVISTDPNNPGTWPIISFDELPKYREELKKYVDKNQVFSDDVFQNMGQYLLNRTSEYYTRIIFDYNHFLIDVYREFPDRIPIKTFAFGILEWQIPGTKVERSILLSQLWLDEENEPSIILNYFIPCQTSDCTEKFIDYYSYIESGVYEPMPLYFSANDESDGYIFTDLDKVEQALVKQENSEILKIDDLFKKWIEEQKIPKELESKLLYTKIWSIVE